MTAAIPRPSAHRLDSDIATLAKIVDPDAPGWTRRAFTPWFVEARKWLTGQMKEAGLEVHVDASSNLIGYLPGEDSSLPPIVIGSHSDTIESGGGRFDGIVGVVCALEVSRLLNQANIRLRHSLEVVDFTAEEATDAGISTVGSQGMVGDLTPEKLALKDSEGRTISDLIAHVGGRPHDIIGESRRPGDIDGFYEVHVEQGPTLDDTGNILGAVTGIVGLTRYEVNVFGRSDHAGGTPMDIRRDALACAAEIILALEALCSNDHHTPVVGTTSRVRVDPDSTSAIAGRVWLSTEVRSLEEKVLRRLEMQFSEAVHEIARRRGLRVDVDPVQQVEALPVSPEVRSIVLEACKATDPRVLEISSGGVHDANRMAKLGPIGMIFVPSRDGRSHCPEEFTESAHVAAGAEALLRAVLLHDERSPSFSRNS